MLIRNFFFQAEDGIRDVAVTGVQTCALPISSGQQPLFGPGGMAKEAAQQVQFNLTERGIDFLGYRTLKHLLGSIGKSSFGAHDTEHLATGIEARSEEHTSELQSRLHLVCRLLLEKKKQNRKYGI